MIRPCLATLAQLALVNPQACIEAKGIDALMRNVAESSQVQAAEATLGVIFYLYNYPHTRSLLKDKFGLENLLAPFTDSYYRFPNCVDGTASEDKDPNLCASKLAVVSSLLSWPGLIYMCKSDSSHLQSIVEMLHLPYVDLRRNILDLLYLIFDVAIPEWTDDFSIALSSCDPSAPKTSWQLYEGYIVAEGTDILPYSSKDRTNLVYNYYALLVLVFVNCGLLEALSKVIITSEIYLAVRATIFLGEFIYMANQFLPTDCSHLSNCLPMLIASSASFESSQVRNQSAAAITCLYRVHELKKKGAVPNSLVLSNILHVCNPDREKKGFFAGTVNKIKLWKYLKQEMNENVDQAIKDTQVLVTDHLSWDWNLVDCILKNPSDSLKKFDDANHRAFMRKLFYFFKPSSKEFSEMESDRENGRQICVTGCHLLEFFLELEEVKAQEFLDDFLNDLNICLVQLTKDSERLNSILSPIKVSNTFSQMYFLFIGKLSSTHKGCKYLNRCNTFQNLLRLVNVSNQDVYIKLIVSTLDYTKEGFSRAILTKVLTGSAEATRLYATNFLLILLRAELPDFRKWAIEVLIYQLHDTNKLVSAAALDTLDEACTIQENLEALISLRPPLLHLGDKGLLLLIRYLSVRTGFNFLRESNFLSRELERWKKIYNLKYVKVVEDLLNEAFTLHRRGDNGTYGRRTSVFNFNSRPMRSVYLPTHMYSQLVQHCEGVKIIEREVMSELCSIVHSPRFNSEMELLQLKASLWAVGHIGSYPLGLELVIRENVISCIVELAGSAPVLAIRGTCYFALGLLCSTPEGAAVVKEHGWEAVQRNHEDKWPLIKEEFLSGVPEEPRKSTWSFNSMSGEWPFGSFPTSLSFIVKGDRSGIPRTDSQYSVSSLADPLQSSTDSKGFAELSSAADSGDVRPRSSSDCQSDRKEGGALFQVSESSSWDTLDTCSSFSSPPPNFNRYAKRRSISTPEVDPKIFDLNEEEDIEESNKDSQETEESLHSKSSCPVISISSNQSSAVTNLSPVSPHPPSKSPDLSLDRPSLLKQLSREHSMYLKSPDSPEKNPPFLLTSARDAIGYATLKDIQRRRVNSLSFHDASLANTNLSLRHLKSHSLDANSARIFNVTQSDFPFETEGEAARNASQDAKKEIPSDRYIGLCLPSDLDFLFSVPKLFSNSDDTNISVSEIEQASHSPGEVFEFHSLENCLSNHAFSDKRCIQTTIIDEEMEECVSPVGHKSVDNIYKKIMPLERQNSIRGLIKAKDDSFNNQYLINKEAMKFVTNLSSSVAVTASEQGLLNLKQKFPNAFQDICLYSEISFYMATYNFRLSARRFLQELFLDANFEQLQSEAEAIVGTKSIPQGETAEN